MRKGFLWSLGLGLFAALAVTGCGGDGTKGSNKDTKVAAGSTENKHEGWWCGEHGIPEGECSMCSAKVAAEFKKKGDWCDKHECALSQCFICKPERKEFYAAKYREKYGKEPPPTEADEKKAKEDEKNKKGGK